MFRKCFIPLFLQILPLTSFGAGNEKGIHQTAHTLTAEESAVLDRFFHAWIEEVEGGYVLYGQKPVCAHAYNKKLFSVVSPWHSNSVALWEGARVWKKFAPIVNDSDIVICSNEEERIPGWVHLFLINRPAFLKVVNDNHTLFQYVLGPKVTADELLKNIASSFDMTLHEDKVLIGIVLGYGRENALYASRIADISTYLKAVEDIPLKHEQFTAEEQLEGFFLPKPGTRYSYKTVYPSFGFSDLSEEVKILRDAMTISSEKLENVAPQFIFSHIQDHSGMELITILEKTQDKIRKFLSSETFLQDILERLLNTKIAVSRPESFKFNICNKKEINKIIARGIWEEELCDYEKEFIPCFIHALTSTSLEEDCDPLLTEPSLFRDIFETNKNLAETTALFCALKMQKDMQCIVPDRLYYKIINDGEDEKQCQSPKVRINYTFFNTLGHALQYQANAVIDLNSTISGFAYGIKGMRKGETREIYIHPSLAYGTYTPYEKGLALKVVVTLIEEIQSEASFQELTSVDLSFLSDESFLESVKKRYKDTLVWNGYAIGAHLKKSMDVDIESIKKHLQDFLDEKESFSPLISEEKDLVNKVHWNIYFGS